MLKDDQDKNGRKLNVEIKKGKFYDAKIKEDHISVERMLSKVKKLKEDQKEISKKLYRTKKIR